MKIASFALVVVFVLVTWQGCSSRTAIGGADADGGAGTSGSAGGFAGHTPPSPGTAGAGGTSVTLDGVGGSLGLAGVGAAGTGLGAAGIPGLEACPAAPAASNLFLPVAAIAYPGDSWPGALAVGDLNNDGRADVAIGGFDNTPSGAGGTTAAAASASVWVHLADKARSFSAGTRYPAMGTVRLQLGDLDGTGGPDLISLSMAGPTTWLNDGKGAFGAPASFVAGAAIASSATGDLDGDGKAEIVLFAGKGEGVGEVVVLKGAGASGYSARRYLEGLQLDSVGIADLDGSGKPDLVAAGVAGVRVLLNDGTGNLVAFAALPSPLSEVAFVDLDGDGRTDVVGRDPSGGFSVLTNLGGGSLAVPRRLAIGGRAPLVAFGDVDGDGKADAISASFNCAGGAVYLNDGKGSLALAGSLALRNDVLQLALGDVDGDGSLDVVSTSRAGVDFMLHRPR